MLRAALFNRLRLIGCGARELSGHSFSLALPYRLIAIQINRQSRKVFSRKSSIANQPLV